MWVSPALRMLSTEIWDDVEEARVGTLRVIFQDTGIDVLKDREDSHQYRSLKELF